MVISDPINIPNETPSTPSGSVNSSSSNSQHRQTASFSRSFSATPIQATRPPILREFECNGWSFKSVRSSISSASQIEALSHEIGFPLPTMFFGCNKISISNSARNFSLEFSPIDAVKQVSKSADAVPIRIAASHADFWRQRSQSEVIFDYDWTYSPQSYHGTCSQMLVDENSDMEIDFNRLKQQDPILFFDENILYEDELGDNGISMISVKLRVMEYGFYVLLTHFLRVDQVIFKVTATRYYHEFAQNYLLKDVRTLEDSFESILEKMTVNGANFKDNDMVQQLLPITSKTVHKLTFQ